MANDFASFRFTSGMDVWVADDRECWVRGIVTESQGDTLKVRTVSNKSEKVITVGPNIERELLPANLPQNTNISDIIKTEYLHEASLLETLRVRHSNATSFSSSGIACEEIYTYAGPVLLSCNPYKRLAIYGPDVMHRYSAAMEQFTMDHHHVGTLHEHPDDETARLPPHVFCIAQDAYSNAMLNDRSSAIVITGESGAGKTEAMKLMLRYLTVVAPNVGGGSGSSAIEKRLLDSSPITEAFGNAKTVRNDNSSRFGKFMELVLDKQGCISGGNLRNYMLEKSRISAISAEERSYHIFYMVCEGSTAEEREFLSIPDPEATGQPAALAFNLLKNGKMNVPEKDDAKDMDELRQAVSTCGFSDDIWRQMLSVVAAVLHLSNITFAEGPNDTSVMDQEVGSVVARLLGVECDTLTYCLTHKVINPTGVQQPGGRKRSVTVKNLNAQQAGVAAASLAQALYSSMFNFIIHQINSAVIPPSGPRSRSIGLLDIFGFEIFTVNKFEQLCINYTNEKLQNLFNHHMFELELQEYATEEVDIAQITFHDNNKTVALFEMKKTGIFDMLDDEMVVPKATDLTFLDRLTRETMGKHESFDRGKSMHDGFVVKHYAHNVRYNVEGFIQKNSDLLTEDITSCLSTSSSTFVVNLLSFGEDKGEGTSESVSVNLQDLGVGVAKAKRKTVGSAFKQQLVSLCERIGTMSTFYVRTFKTNTNKSSGEFDRPLMLMQLKCSGVMEVMKIRIAGFPTRIKFAEFVRRFWPLYPQARSMQLVDACAALLEASKLPAETFAFGKTKVFMKDRPFSQLVIMVKEVLEAQARELLRFVRRLMCQRRLAAVTRRALVNRGLIQKYRAFISIAAVAKRIKIRNRWVAKITFDGEVAAKNAAERAARKKLRDAAQKSRVQDREDRETKDRLRKERLISMRSRSEPIELLAAELLIPCPDEVEAVSERQFEGVLLKYRADKMFKTWQSRICTIEGLALVYKGKADGKVRGVVSLKDCTIKPGPEEFEGSFVIKSGTPFPTDIKDKKNRSFMQGREYIFKPDPKNLGASGIFGVRDEWFRQIIIAQIVSVGTLWMPLSRFNKLNSEAQAHLQKLSAQDEEQAKREAEEDAEAEAAAAAEADAQNFWPSEAAVTSGVKSVQAHRDSRSGANASLEAAIAVGHMRLSDSSSISASQSAGRSLVGAGVTGVSHSHDDDGGGGGGDDDDDDDEAPPPFHAPSEAEDWT